MVAEGVETQDVLAHLADRGCDRAQGYLLSRPMTLTALTDWLSPIAAPGVPAPGVPATKAAGPPAALTV